MGTGIRQVVELLEHKCYGGGVDIYSTPLAEGAMGAGDRVIIHTAIGRIMGGTSASAEITLSAEDSADGQDWATISPDLHSGEAVTWDDLPKTLRGEVPFPHGRYLRLKLTIGGTNPTVWLSMRGTVKPGGGG